MQCYWCKSNAKRFWNSKYRNSIATYLLNTRFPSVLFFKISHTFLAGTWAFPHIFSTNWPLTINSWTYQKKKILFWTASNVYNSILKTIQTAMQSGFNMYSHFLMFCWPCISVYLSFLVINQPDAQNLFYNKFISCLYMFQAPCAHHQEVRIVLCSLWYHHTYRWLSLAQVERVLSQPVHGTATYRCDGTSRGCIIQFWPPGDERMVLETCRGMK